MKKHSFEGKGEGAAEAEAKEEGSLGGRGKKSDKERHTNIYVISCVGSGEEELEKGNIE